MEFFKIYQPEIDTTGLQIPPAIINSLHGSVPRDTFIHDEFGIVWNVMLERHGGNCYIGKGWESFASDNSLGHGDFLLFIFDGNALFSVKVFSVNRCKKDKSPVRVSGNNFSLTDAEQEVHMGRHVGCANSSAFEQYYQGSRQAYRVKTKAFDYLRFVKTFGALNHYMRIPKRAMEVCNKNLRERITIRYQNEISYPIKICEWKDQYVLAGGWKNFCEKNQILIGDECEFHLVLDEYRRIKEIKAKISHKATPKPVAGEQQLDNVNFVPVLLVGCQ